MNIFKFFKKTERNQNKIFDGLHSQFMMLPPDLNTAEYLKMYGEVGYIYACINKRAEAVSNTDFIIEDKNGNQKEHSLALALLNKPNPFMSKTELLSITIKHLDTVGTAFWYIARSKSYGVPAEIHIINPMYMYVVPDENDFIKGYVYKCGKHNVPLDTDEVIMFQVSNPLTPYSGVSPLKALAATVETEKYSTEWNRNFFYNNATPNGIITYERSLNDNQFDRVKEQWNSNYGGLSNAHKVAILENGAKYQNTGVSQRDMDFSVMKGINKKEIIGVYGVPELLITGEAQNRATAEVQEEIFYKNTIRPLLRLITDKLNNEYMPLFKFETGYILKFIESMNGDKEFIKSVLDTQVNKSITVNESRKILSRLLGEDFVPLQGGDELMISPATVPLSIMSEFDYTTPQESEPHNEEEEIEEEKSLKKKDFFKSVNKKIKSNSAYYQAQILKLSLSIEKDFIKDLNAEFKSQCHKIAQNIHEGNYDFDNILSDEKMIKLVKKHIEKALKQGGKTNIDLLKSFCTGFTKDESVEFKWTDTSGIIEEAIKIRADKAKGLNKTTRNLISKIIKDLIEEENLSIEQIKKKLMKTGAFTKARAKTIAQTETLGAINEGSYYSMKENDDIIGGKAWLTNVDEHVRDTHAQAGFEYTEYNPIPVDDYFIIGGEKALHPLDSNLSAKNVVNCRCCMLSVLKEE